jgi:hypothetical protein
MFIVYLSKLADLLLIQLSKYEIKIQMDFNVIDSVINAVFFCTTENSFRCSV